MTIKIKMVMRTRRLEREIDFKGKLLYRFGTMLKQLGILITCIA
jgi:hypothetical protein